MQGNRNIINKPALTVSVQGYKSRLQLRARTHGIQWHAHLPGRRQGGDVTALRRAFPRERMLWGTWHMCMMRHTCMNNGSDRKK